MSQSVMASEFDATRYPREKTPGALMGLWWCQVFFNLGVLGAVVVVFLVVPFPLSPILGIGLLVLGWAYGSIKIFSRPLLVWTAQLIRFRIRGRKGQLQYRRKLPTVEMLLEDESEQTLTAEPGGAPEATVGEEDLDVDVEDEINPWRDKYGRIKPGPGHRFGLPGEANELIGYELPEGIAFIFDPIRKEGIVCAQLQTSKAFDLESFENMEARTKGFRAAQRAIAEMPGVVRWQLSDQTTLVSGAKVENYFDEHRMEAPLVEDEATGEMVPYSGPQINAFLDASFRNLMSQAQGMPIHELWMTVVFSATELQDRIESSYGGLRGFMEVCLGTMVNLDSVMPSAGVTVSGWHTLRTLAALSRSAFDPEATLMISERTGDRTGVRPEEAGPMALDAGPSYVESDGVLHRTYAVSEWPQEQAQLGFLESMIFAGEFRHTVTVVCKPREKRAALRGTQGEKADWEASESTRQKLKRPDSLEHRRQIEDINQNETELVRGNAALKQGALITVSGKDVQELEANSSDLLSKAAEANCELRLLWFEQDNGFVAAALPFAQVVID
ncbi:SCO6880 family protein [Nesterenkonia marinintestina]|uniref:SCO6880 family protein n=1 Tax=Nesterenkonia marinintestina TaxID=2979865 RepID=UPI0021BEAD79|nr:SCO6880 family protein [Nesterenkonia sp. GX14115]